VHCRDADRPLYRIGRRPDPWAWPDWLRAGGDRTFGNRWDDPRGVYRVLYAASSLLGAFDGISYLSRLGDEFRNWALFEPVRKAQLASFATDVRSHEISPAHPDFRRALVLLDIRLVA
jgi:hypothetical protein